MAWSKQKIRLVPESEAGKETLAIYQEIKHALGLPYVNPMFQALAAFPEYFRLLWHSLAPALNTREFFTAAQKISAESYTRVHNYLNVPDLIKKMEEMDFSTGAQDELRDVTDLYLYNNSVLLLILAAQIQAFENPGATPRPATAPSDHPTHPEPPILVNEKNAPPDTRKIYDDIKKTMGTPFLNTSYINFGRWPDFLREYWNALKPVILSPQYEQNGLAIRESALALAAELPQPLQLSPTQLEEAGVSPADLSAVIQLTEFFLQLLSKQLLNIAFAKIGLEGGAHSTAAA
ncbi:MAG: halocarboxylic acid dehydrogenase DehI family protein [Candidatus Angelobacter sp.]